MKGRLPVQELRLGKGQEERCACGKLLSQCECEEGCKGGPRDGCCGGGCCHHS